MFSKVKEARFKALDWKEGFRKEKRRILIALIFIAIAIISNYASSAYAEKRAASVVSDIILDSIGPFDLSFLFVYGYVFIIAVLLLYPLLFRVQDFYQTAYHFSLLIVMRSIFIIMTHLKTPVDAIIPVFPWPISLIPFQNSMFFSGHTAIPLVGFFVFRDSPIRYFFLLSSIVMGVTVLLMHQHYTIDVASAFFIAYGAFKLGEWMHSLVENRGKHKEFMSDRLY